MNEILWRTSEGPSQGRVARWLREKGQIQLRTPGPGGQGVLFALETPRREHGLLLAALYGFLMEGGKVYCLDAGNCFNPYPLALAARARGLPPERVLEQVYVSRAATCHQIVAVVEEMLPPLRGESGPKMAAALALDTLFVDEDIPFFERRYLFQRTLFGIAAARAAGLGCLVTHNAASENGGDFRVWRSLIQRILKPTRIPEGLADGTNHPHLHPLSRGRDRNLERLPARPRS
ncbi:MAG: hypothetical protein HUU16_11465 [Candidatus Omnitrophica bacterium]|nr:hypothetical protein [Candidatus Omnitrophota bacterium]